jgi:hypothetical protein
MKNLNELFLVCRYASEPDLLAYLQARREILEAYQTAERATVNQAQKIADVITTANTKHNEATTATRQSR